MEVKSGYLKQYIMNHGTNIIPTLPRPLPLMWACQWAWASLPLLLADSALSASSLLWAATLATGPS